MEEFENQESSFLYMSEYETLKPVEVILRRGMGIGGRIMKGDEPNQVMVYA
jgi:hypothetical protein